LTTGAHNAIGSHNVCSLTDMIVGCIYRPEGSQPFDYSFLVWMSKEKTKADQEGEETAEMSTTMEKFKKRLSGHKA